MLGTPVCGAGEWESRMKEEKGSRVHQFHRLWFLLVFIINKYILFLLVCIIKAAMHVCVWYWRVRKLKILYYRLPLFYARIRLLNVVWFLYDSGFIGIWYIKLKVIFCSTWKTIFGAYRFHSVKKFFSYQNLAEYDLILKYYSNNSSLSSQTNCSYFITSIATWNFLP